MKIREVVAPVGFSLGVIGYVGHMNRMYNSSLQASKNWLETRMFQYQSQ